MIKRNFVRAALAVALLTFPAVARLQALQAQNAKAWIIKSNSYTRLLTNLEVDIRLRMVHHKGWRHVTPASVSPQ